MSSVHYISTMVTEKEIWHFCSQHFRASHLRSYTLHIRSEPCYALPTRRAYQCCICYYYLIFLSGLFCPYNVSICVFYVPNCQFVTVISVFAGSNCDQSSRVFSDFCSCSFWLQQANPVYHSWALCCIMCTFIMCDYEYLCTGIITILKIILQQKYWSKIIIKNVFRVLQ